MTMATSATYKGTTYANGALPKKWLAPLDGENYATPGDPAVLREDAAASWNAARAEVKAKTGITLTVRGWYRPVPQQVTFFLQRYRANAHSAWNDYRWYNGVRYGRVTGAPAAIPGTSNHGLGTTVDVVDFGSYGTKGNARREKAMPILRKYGWTDGEGMSIDEPWHLEYVPSKNTRKTTTPQQEELMADGLNTEQATQLSTIHSVLTRKLTDGSGATTPDQIWQRNLDVARRTLAAVTATNTALSAAVETLAKSAGLDPVKVEASVEKAVRDALSDGVTLIKES